MYIPVFKAVYALQLENDKYYIGTSYNINQSFGEHFAGLGPISTRIYKPLSIIECHINSIITLDVLIIIYRHKYGATNIFGDNILSSLQQENLTVSQEILPDPKEDLVVSQEILPDPKEILTVSQEILPDPKEDLAVSQEILPDSTENLVDSKAVKIPEIPKKKNKPVKKAKKPTPLEPEVNTFVPDTKVITLSSTEKQEKPTVVNVEKDYSKSYRETLSQTAAQTKSDNISKGITTEDLLTKDNLDKWINDEKRSYVYIAQHLVGCTDKEVSAAAKSFGLSTSFSLRRQMIVARKK